MKVSRERWNEAQIQEYVLLNEHTDCGEEASIRSIETIFNFLNLKPEIDLKNKIVVEVGSGFFPALLLVNGLKKKIAVDPLFNTWPEKYKKRAIDANIEINTDPYEEFIVDQVDETWFFNVLQHVIDPEEQLKKAMRTSKIIRVFEPVGLGNGIPLSTDIAHPHSISKKLITDIMGDFGSTYKAHQLKNFHEAECYYGTWKKK